MMREIIGVKPRNAVERDVELAVLKAANAGPQVFHEAGAVRIDRPYAGRELDDVGVISRGRIVVLDEIRAHDRLWLGRNKRPLRRCRLGTVQGLRRHQDRIKAVSTGLVGIFHIHRFGVSMDHCTEEQKATEGSLRGVRTKTATRHDSPLVWLSLDFRNENRPGMVGTRSCSLITAIYQICDNSMSRGGC